MPNITYKSYYYFFILQPEKFSHVMPYVYFRRVVSVRFRFVGEQVGFKVLVYFS